MHLLGIRRLALVILVVGLAAMLGACGTATPTGTPAGPSVSAEPAATASSLPSASPSDGASPAISQPPEGSVVVTLQVAGDQMYRILLTDTDDIAIAYQLLNGEPGPGIPNGKVVRHDEEDGINHGYTWSIDPNDFEWADVTTEVCDGIPSDVEAGVVTSDRYCPWSATVIAVDAI